MAVDFDEFGVFVPVIHSDCNLLSEGATKGGFAGAGWSMEEDQSEPVST